MAALVRAPDIYSPTGLRDRAILATLCACGLRASELCFLQVRDLGREAVFVRKGKFGYQRWVPITSRARAAITEYLAHFRVVSDDAPLFRSIASGGRLSRRHLHKIVTGYSRKLKLLGGVHSLRHSAATRWLDRDISLEEVRIMLGHKHIATTSIYLSLSTQSLIRNYKRALETRTPMGVAA
jgi:integrase/recombinase XerD